MSKPDCNVHKFYANENFPRPAVEHLRAYGHDVLTTSDAGQSNQGISDSQVLQYAIRTERAIITFNRFDFVKLHRTNGGNHNGIVVCSEDRDYKGLAERVHCQVKELPSLASQLIKINRPNSSDLSLGNPTI